MENFKYQIPKVINMFKNAVIMNLYYFPFKKSFNQCNIHHEDTLFKYRGIINAKPCGIINAELYSAKVLFKPELIVLCE